MRNEMFSARRIFLRFLGDEVLIFSFLDMSLNARMSCTSIACDAICAEVAKTKENGVDFRFLFLELQRKKTEKLENKRWTGVCSCL